jgi:hypothetical protein
MPETDNIKEYYKEFQMLQGAYLAGNDNPEIKKSLRDMVLILIDHNKIKYRGALV